MENETKLCKHCKAEIPKDAKVCPNCRKKQGGKLKWVVIAIVALGVIGAAVGGGSDKDQEAKKTGEVGTSQSTESESAKEVIEYTPVTVNDLMAELDENALEAADTYKDAHLEVTGRLANIDSSGDYIALYPDDEFALSGVQCYIQDESQLEIVKTLKTDSTVTVRGTCTSVGEVLGYSLDIEEIVQ